MIIAITGCIGSGKSYILNLIHQNYGYDTFSSDIIAKTAYEDEIIKAKLDEAFNCVINNKVDKQIIKDKLNEESIQLLNSIIHPYVKNKIIEIKAKYTNSISFVEVPLLFESKMENIFDKVLVISSNEDVRLKRLQKRDPISYKDMLKLQQYQFSDKEKVERADYVIQNNDNLDDTVKQIDELIKIINSR